MLKVFTTIILLGVAFTASAHEFRYSSNTTQNGHAKPAFKQSTGHSDSRHSDRYKASRQAKHNQYEYAKPYSQVQHTKVPHRQVPHHFKQASLYSASYHSKHAKVDNRFDNRYIQTNRGHQPSKHAKSHKVNKMHSQLKRHHILPKHLAYSRVPTRVEHRLGRLPSHLMRVAIGKDIAVIHIKNRIVHEIIRGLL